MAEFKAIKEFLQPSPVLLDCKKVSGAVITVSSHDSTHLDIFDSIAAAECKLQSQVSDVRSVKIKLKCTKQQLTRSNRGTFARIYGAVRSF